MEQFLPFFESIRLCNGQFELLELHEQRMKVSQQKHFAKTTDFKLADYLNQFNPPTSGLFKCRLAYGMTLATPEFIFYAPKSIKKLFVIEADQLDYASKYADRSAINSLYEKRQNCDDILITQNGCIKDTSYCNIVFGNKMGWYTPDEPLLNGVQRQNLLSRSVIKPMPIKVSDLKRFTHFRLVNAMIPWEESKVEPIHQILM